MQASTQLRIRASIAGLSLVLAAAPAAAQQPMITGTGPEVIDKILAVVGDSVITQTELQEAVLQELAAGPPPQDTAKLREDLLKQKVDELVLLQAAAADSIEAPADQVDAAVQRDIAQRQQAFGGAQAMQEALQRQGMTLDEFRELLRAQWKRNLVIQTYLQRQQQTRNPPPVTEEQIRSYFEEHKGELAKKPATITFRQVVVAPQPSDSARAAAFKEATKVLDELRKGADFATLAKRYSDDPSTKDQGGDLGWSRRGQFVEAFEDAAYSLPPGAVSNIVETPYGLHIIKVEKVRGPERQVRHILIQPERKPEDVQRAKDLAERLAQELRAGADIDSMISKYSDPSEQSRVGPFELDKLPPPYDQALANAATGEIVGPIELGASSQSPTKFAVVRVTATSPAGDYTVEDLRSQIRQRLENDKLTTEIIDDLRAKTYIDVRH